MSLTKNITIAGIAGSALSCLVAYDKKNNSLKQSKKGKYAMKLILNFRSFAGKRKN